MLRKHLAGNAKTLIGDHHSNLDEALKVLISYFGDEQKIWNSCKEKFSKSFNGDFMKVWGKYGDETRVLAFARVIEFVRESMELAESYPNLTNEIYHSSTINIITKVLPRDVLQSFNDLMNGQKLPMKEMFSFVKDYLEQKKNSAVASVTQVKDVPKRNDDNNRRFNFGRKGQDGKACAHCEDGKIASQNGMVSDV